MGLQHRQMQCKGRRCNEAREIKLPLMTGYFTERRCSAKATENGYDNELCERCSEQKKNGFVCKNQQSYYQGKIDEPYFENSWLFGSPRFFRYSGIPGNAISAEGLRVAEEAQRITRGNNKMKTAIETDKNKTTEKVMEKKKVRVVSKPSVKSVAVESSDEPIEVLKVIHVQKPKTSS